MISVASINNIRVLLTDKIRTIKVCGIAALFGFFLETNIKISKRLRLPIKPYNINTKIKCKFFFLQIRS